MGARLLIVTLLLLSLFLPANAQCALATARSEAPENQKKWDPTGEWAAKNSDWKGKITIRPDGSFARGIGDGGKWRLTNQNGQAALELNWEKWDTQVLSMISPDLFRGKVRRGTFELRRIQTTSTAEEKPQPEKEWLEEYQAPALRERLSDSVWRLKDGKRFTLRADGSTSGSWHNRKGRWRIIGSNKIQLTMNWKPSAPAVATVESDGTVLRWSDSEWGQVAKRIEPKRDDGATEPKR